MKTKIMMLFAALYVAMSVSAQSGEQAYMKGLALFNKQDYKSAVKYFEKSANKALLMECLCWDVVIMKVWASQKISRKDTIGMSKPLSMEIKLLK